MTDTDIMARIRRLEDRAAIGDLQACYTLAIDDRDLDRAAPLFAVNGRFRSADGVLDAIGREAIVRQYQDRFAALRFGFHTTQDHLITFDPVDPDRASGVVSSHAEVVRNGAAMIAGMRYYDVYVREEGAWRFADRLLRFFYYLPVRDYADVLCRTDRMRAYGDARPADLPEGLPTFPGASA